MAQEYMVESSEKLRGFFSQTSWAEETASRIAVENQLSYRDRNTQSAILVAVEIVAYSKDVSADSRLPVYDTSFKVRPASALAVHKDDVGEHAQKLAGGGDIRKQGDKYEINLANSDKIKFDVRSGALEVDSFDKYQKEVHYKGSQWQETVLTSDHDTRITFGKDKIRSIESNGVLEVFPNDKTSSGKDPVRPASSELAAIFLQNGRRDLVRSLNIIDRKEEIALESLKETNGSQESVKALADSLKDRGILLEKAAALAPGKSESLYANAESQFRNALRNLREKFGAGTPETKASVEALQTFLKTHGERDQQEEVERLGFEARRAYLISNVIDNIEGARATSVEDMPQWRSNSVRSSLISMHIASGDNGLKTFVSDVNKRLQEQELIAPVYQGGFLRHGAILLTPEGPTRYNGSFDLRPARNR